MNRNFINLIKIRNAIIPQFHNLLHKNSPFNKIGKELISMYYKTKHFCKDNPDILFTRADNVTGGGVTEGITVMLDKDIYL